MKSYKRSFLALTLLVTASLSAFSQNTSASVDSNETFAVAQIVIEDQFSRYSGSAVNIDPYGRYLTNYHVVEPAILDPSLEINVCVTVDLEKPPFCMGKAKIEKYDKSIDIALIYLDSIASSWTSEGELVYESYEDFIGQTLSIQHIKTIQDSVELGEDVFILGYPVAGGETITFTKGNVSGFDAHYIKTDAKINSGNSGGGVFNEKSELVGIATAVSGGQGNIGWAISGEHIKEFLNGTSFDGTPCKHMLNSHFVVSKCICDWKHELKNGQCVSTEIKAKDEDSSPSETKSNGSISSSSSPKINSSSFSDVNNTHKNISAITYLKEKNVIDGYADGSFKPENPVNRAELLKILIESKEPSFKASDYYEDCFSDTKKDEWFTPYACYAKNKGWVNGYEKGDFRPAQTVSKSEAVKIILNAFSINSQEASGDMPFADVKESDWYFTYLKKAHDMNFLEELSGRFNPNQGMTRAGVSEVIYRIMKYMSEPSI